MFVPRDYQVAARRATFDYFDTHGGMNPATNSPFICNPVVAMPTGTGKSIVIGETVEEAFARFPSTRALMLTHVKELIQQNANKLLDVWPNAPLGVVSAGLKRREWQAPVVYGGVKTVVNNIDALGHRDFCLVDECHLVGESDTSMYHKAFSRLRGINPWIKFIGYSATPFRLGQGHLTDGGLFTDVCFDACTPEAWRYFLENNYLVPPIPLRTKAQYNLTGVGTAGGDYQPGALAARMAEERETTYLALKEMCHVGADRRAWLVFCAGIDNAETVAAMLREMWIPAAAIHSKLDPDERDRRIEAFKRGELRCLTNNNVLTVGFDHPAIDLIGVLRATKSPGLHVQMIGRGTRPYPGKINCLVLDYVGNTRRLGPIDDPTLPKKKGESGGGAAPVKDCPHCGMWNHLRATICALCGNPFEIYEHVEVRASDKELLRAYVEEPKFEEFDVDAIMYLKTVSAANRDNLRVVYHCGRKKFREHWQFDRPRPDYEGTPARTLQKSLEWWRVRFPNNYEPETTDDARANAHWLRKPSRIRVHTNSTYQTIKGYYFDDGKPSN